MTEELVELIAKWRTNAKACAGETEYDEGASITWVLCADELEALMERLKP